MPRSRFQFSRLTIFSLIVVGLCLIVIWWPGAKLAQLPVIKPSPTSLPLPVAATQNNNLPKEGQMKLLSPAFTHNDFIPEKYTCDGENVNPPLTIDGVLPGVQSLVLIVDDPDAPSGDWVHWLVYNLKPALSVIPENSLPLGAIAGLNSFGQNDYGGPCPPSGTHRYQFKLYALNTSLDDDLSPLSKKADFEAAMDGHIIDQAILIGLYSQK